MAKILLESAKEDRHFRLEAAEFQEDPTASLVAIRESGRGNSRSPSSEWVFLSQYIQIATENLNKNAVPPPAPAFISLFEAFLAARSFRTVRGGGT
jgi:hypothetical protein